jgi:hypothetical protein
MTDGRACCDTIVQTVARVDGMERDLSGDREDSRSWRSHHEQRETAEFGEVKAALAILAEGQQAIMKLMANRMPPWGTVVITLSAATIGALAAFSFDLLKALAMK